MVVNNNPWLNEMKIVSCVVIVLLCSAPICYANQFCAALAETYYEQVYCQLQAKAQTKQLPAFHQFRKNTEVVQYSLLKRIAERNAIKLAAPARKKPVISSKEPSKVALSVAPTTSLVEVDEPSVLLTRTQGSRIHNACELHGRSLQCGTGVFNLIGNRANHRLAGHVLSADNKMGLPGYQGGNLDQYLAQAYEAYLAKMCEIGLGGVSMTYRKFAYLYQDLHTKGLDFTKRFETMFGFLKKDKSTMGVSESVAVPSDIDLRYCSPVGMRFYVCDVNGRNYIFAAP